jgi:hypothetical protein
MSTKPRTDASAPLDDPWFEDDDDEPSDGVPHKQRPQRSRKQRTTIAPLPKKT